jgi:site-specific DNA recombinase
MGGAVPLGYRLADRKLLVDAKEAKIVRGIYEAYVRLGCVRKLAAELKALGVLRKRRISKSGRKTGGVPYSRGALYSLLANRLYLGEVAHRGAVYAGEHQAIIERKLWERVQARLASNRAAKRNGARAEEPSLLAGLLFDERGHRLTPSHCVTRGKRYRYYFSQALLGERSEHTSAVRRLPAAELERLVTRRCCTLLASSPAVLEATSEHEDDARMRATLVTSANELATKLPKCSVSERRDFALAVTAKIVVTERAIEITIAKGLLRLVLLGLRRPDEVASATAPTGAEDVIMLRVDTQLRRCGSEVRLVVPPESAPATHRVDQALVKAIARGRAWYEELMSDRAGSLGEIADRLQLHQRYVGRIIRCAFLAPDIVEAVLEGRQPPTLTVEKLRLGVPLAWEAQRRLFGFT